MAYDGRKGVAERVEDRKDVLEQFGIESKFSDRASFPTDFLSWAEKPHSGYGFDTSTAITLKQSTRDLFLKTCPEGALWTETLSLDVINFKLKELFKERVNGNLEIIAMAGMMAFEFVPGCTKQMEESY